MNIIALPKKIEFIKGEQPNQKKVIIEPCFPGYGTTLGNALRRVLISSLPGAAVVGVKIKGASHEFMALPHIKEDVLEIVMNLKQLRLKLHSDEVIKLELDIHGEKKVKAGDIKKNSQAEIINSDLILANITDMAGSLNMEIYASRGVGYETIEGRENKKRETGYIEIDSIFSPVWSVGINIENVRVSKMTNWEKLILDIKTDGTITPEESFNQATEILIKQFRALIGKVDKLPKEDDDKEKDKDKEKKEEEKSKKADDDDKKKPELKEEKDPEKKKRGRPAKNK